ncbi:LLM class F420-dependent oxidoreductase [Phenylobacterium sp.]|jgi:probable F420-dependent oxidoreductase|uniref:LLM class F420-dependent oxidoreductase n=1 Tax=Phenylobacterium sp. TaxID=1871053 RepID=UPI002F3FA0E6
MKMTMHIPMDIDDRVEFQNAAAVRAMAQAIEKAGVDACFITDHPAPTAKWRAAGGHDALDPFAGLMFVAAVTSRLRVHTNLVVLPYRNPFLTAKSAATLDVLSEGRLILGVGLGYLRGEYQALGADFEGRGAVMDEALETIKAAWGEAPVAREGRSFTASDIRSRPRPIQLPHPPIWAGGNSERAIRRAAELCDGWSPFFATATFSKSARTDEIANVDDLKVKIDHLRGHLDRVGRTLPFDICIGPQQGLKACTKAEAERWVDDAGKMMELGATWTPCGVPHPSREAFLENVQWFGEEVVPKIHALATR